MLSAELCGNLITMILTKYLRLLKSLFNLLFSMLIRGKFDRLFIILRSAVIRVTEMAVELTLDYKFFTLTFHHTSFHTLSAGSFIAAF